LVRREQRKDNKAGEGRRKKKEEACEFQMGDYAQLYNSKSNECQLKRQVGGFIKIRVEEAAEYKIC
jgi:hypothetical protein